MKVIHAWFFNAAQPGVGRVQVLGSKKFQTEDQEQFFQWRRNIYGHSGLVRTKFLENHIENAIRDSRFYSIVLISPDQVVKRSYATVYW